VLGLSEQCEADTTGTHGVQHQRRHQHQRHQERDGDPTQGTAQRGELVVDKDKVIILPGIPVQLCYIIKGLTQFERRKLQYILCIL